MPGIAVLLCLDRGISNGSIGEDLNPARAVLHSRLIGHAMISYAWHASWARAIMLVHALLQAAVAAKQLQGFNAMPQHPAS